MKLSLSLPGRAGGQGGECQSPQRYVPGRAFDVTGVCQVTTLDSRTFEAADLPRIRWGGKQALLRQSESAFMKKT